MKKLLLMLFVLFSAIMHAGKHDHAGSTVGSTVASHSCDAWGCLHNPSNQAVIGVGAGAGAVTSATNNVIAQTGSNFEGFNNVDWEQVGISSAVGGVAGAAGAGAGYWASNASVLVNGVSSPILRSAAVSPIAAGAGHVAGGTTAGLFQGQNLGEAFANSFDGVGKSMAVGGTIGVATTIGVSYANGINPWTGTKIVNNSSNSTKTDNHGYKYDQRVRMRALDDPTSHNFPYSFDEHILSTTPIVKSDGYLIYRLEGTMNGINGYYEIGVHKGIIDHRFFRPIK